MTNEERDNLINSVLPDTVKGQQRPAENLNPDMPYSTDFPQLINKDPASADMFNLINRQLLSNDKSLNDNKADKTYVDKKVADLVNGAPEQLDTLQELSKALNNDKDYAVTVNNALAEKLGKTEKAVSAITADNVSWAGVTDKPSTYPPSAHNHDSAYPTKTGTGASGTWGINITGSSDNAGHLNNLGKQTALSGGHALPRSGLSVYQVYNNGYPCSFGNVLSIGGTGQGQIVAGWSGSDGGIERIYYRNKRDNLAANWSEWRGVAFTTDIPTNFPSKTGAGASGTWGINISGSAGSANAVAWGNVSSKPVSIVKVASWDGSTLNLTTCT